MVRQEPTHYWHLCVMICTMVGLCVASSVQPVAAHSGGTPRLTNSPAGPYRVYAWTDPEPLRVGEIHVSVIVTEQVSGDAQQPERPVTDAAVRVDFVSGSTTLPVIAFQESVLNELYYEVPVDLPHEGKWQVVVYVEGPTGNGQTSFQADVLPARTVNWYLVAAGGGLLVLLLAAMGVWSRTQSKASKPVHTPRARRLQT